MKKILTTLLFAILIIPVSATFAATQEVARTPSSYEVTRGSSSEIARSVSSGEIGREWRVATYTTGEVTRQPEVVTQKEYIYDYVNVPAPTKLVKTGFSENFILMLFALSMIAGGIYLRRRR